MLKDILARFNRKKAPSPESAPAGTVAPSEKKSSKKSLAILVVMGLALAALAFAGTVTFLSSVKEVRQPPLNMTLTSNLPQRPSLAPASTVPGSTPPASAATMQPTVPPLPAGVMKPGPSPQVPPVAAAAARQAQQPVYVAKREVSTKIDSRPVGEFDPFKSEFAKKYEQDEKKKNRSHGRGSDPSLSELEQGLRSGPVRQVVMPPQAPPPPPHKDIKLIVNGVVVSRDGSYAMTDRGIIRVGSSIDSFQVENIEFDRVTLRDKDNNSDVRYLFLTAKNQPGTSQAVTPINPR